MPDSTTVSTIPAAFRTGLINSPANRAPLPVPLTTPSSSSSPSSRALTFGEQAALNYSGGGNTGGLTTAIKTVPGLGKYSAEKVLGKWAPLTGQYGAPLNYALGLGRKNNTPIQDIQQALALGNPVSDASWAKAGYGPGGSNLLTNPIKPLTGVDTKSPGFVAAAVVGLRIGHGNASVLQDIYGAIASGAAVSDAAWAKAGFGPGGSAPSSNSTPANPALGAMSSGLLGVPATVLASRLQK